MAVTRPWVTPQEVREYSDYEDVQTRSDAKLGVDITRAEQAVISYTNNKFDDESLAEIPVNVKTAIILLAENYAHGVFQASRSYKSETLDDWSYTANDAKLSISDMGIESLLDDFKITAASGTVFMRLRKL